MYLDAASAVPTGSLTMPRANLTGQRLAETFPDAVCRLRHDNPLQLVVAVILLAQESEELVNQVTQTLFQRLPSVEALAEADRNDIAAIIRPLSFYRQKARYIQLASEMLVQEYGGQVPEEMAELLRLPGFARKTANIVLGAYFEPQGFVVDTRIKRVVTRLELTKSKGPEAIERELMQQLPRTQWVALGDRIIALAEDVCFRHRPACQRCPLSDFCPSARAAGTPRPI